MNTVADIMTSDVLTVNPQNSVATAIRLMRSGRLRRLPVVENDRLVGIVTSGDLQRITGMSSMAENAAGDNFLWQHIPISNVMAQNLVVVAPETPVADAARLMIEHKIGGLPVVLNDRLVGILTTSDLLSALIDCELSPEPLAGRTL